MYTFSELHAGRAVRFFETQLKYVEGAKAGKPFLLEPWQRQIVRDLFGWLREDGTRRYRLAYVEVPRKNGKSTFAAGIALYLLLADGEKRPQVYSCAGDRAQASIVFNAAREMVETGGKFVRGKSLLRQYKILNTQDSGWYEATSAEGYTAHGRSPSGIIFDELHTQPNRQLWDAMLSGRGAREQPLVIAITTAGHDRSSICWEMHQRSKAAIENPDGDPTFYGVIYGAEPDEDWTSEEVWRKANPNLGVSVSLEFLREECTAAQANPEHENVFRNLYLDQWTQQAIRWIQMAAWDACAEPLRLEDFEGCDCFAALDLASTRDVNALTMLFRRDGTYYAFPVFWVPEDSHGDRTKQDRRQVINWAAKGLIRTTPGNVTDYQTIADDILELGERFTIRKLGYDPWGPARAFAQIIEASGFPVTDLVEFRQTIGNFTAPCKELIRLISSGQLRHGGDPVLRWMAENVAIRRDANDNIRPDKENSADKIDGIVALIMALGLWFTTEDDFDRSFDESPDGPQQDAEEFDNSYERTR
ncbi:MAG: terminase large subunit [Planctomycetales bacterium]